MGYQFFLTLPQALLAQPSHQWKPIKFKKKRKKKETKPKNPKQQQQKTTYKKRVTLGCLWKASKNVNKCWVRKFSPNSFCWKRLTFQLYLFFSFRQLLRSIQKQQYHHSGLLAPWGLDLSHGQQIPLRIRPDKHSKELLFFSPSELGERRTPRLIHQCLLPSGHRRECPLYRDCLASRRTPRPEVSSLAVGRKYQGTSFMGPWMPPRDSRSPSRHRTRKSSGKEGAQHLLISAFLTPQSPYVLSLLPCASGHTMTVSSLSTSMIFAIVSHLSRVAIFFWTKQANKGNSRSCE